MKKTISRLFSTLLAFTLLAGCQAAPPAEASQDKSSVTVVMPPTSEPEAGFDPAFGWGAGEHVHEPLIQSTLTVTNPDLTIGYDLATDMRVSEDGLAWTVKIREGVKFTDGTALTATDVAFTYNAARDASSVNDFTMLDRAEAVDDTTVVFHMNRPFSIWPYTMATLGIVPEDSYDPATYGANPIGSGRYMLKQWDRGQQVILEANPDYYGEKPKIERVNLLFMEEDAAFLAVQAGQADLAYTSASYSDQTVNGFSLLSVKTVDNRGVNLPVTGNEFLSDAAVRRAVNMGIDRRRMIDNVLSGYGAPAYSVCDGMPWYSPANEVAYDPEGARAVLSGAGISLTIHYAAGDSVRQGIAAELANQLKELGVEADIKGVGWDTAYTDALTNPLVWGWGAHTPMELYNIYHTEIYGDLANTARYSPYSNERADELMDAALASTDLEESYTLWQQAQEEIAGDVPWVWLVNVDHLYWVRDGLNVAEQKIHPHGHGWSIANNVDRWTWEM